MAGTPRTMAERLALEPTGPDELASRDPADERHVFGGWLIAQALRAATTTVDADRHAIAVHASFVVAGTPGQRVHHHVERTRDGASFTTRRVTVTQEGGAVLVLTGDFQREEPGAEYELAAVPDVPGPEGLPAGRYDNPLLESRDVPVEAVAGGLPHTRRAWFRVRTPLPDEPDLHLQTIAYLSDFGATRAVREPHAHLADDARRISVSLDHSIWFHRPVDASGWLLSEWTPIASGRGRGLAVGSIRSANGHLAATVAQQALLRERP
ncbi:MAG: acyl-CoA thioesterase [Acidimicrobiia bacterium]